MDKGRIGEHDWVLQDPFFQNKFPFNDLGNPLDLDPAKVENYVKNVIRQAKEGSREVPCDVFELHNDLVARMKIPKQVHIEDLSVFLNNNQIKIEGWPGQDEGKLISLPASIIPHKSKASFKEGYLQIKMPKMRNGNFHELQIRHLK
ncbi:hypothetical protein ERICIV_02342 [Paenibacillus larvae subsp. larvae]|uniref:SHSP domain-containing protein n=1 Tax=Paenibacillus larvae subsp. larvae TaxID=147375 RepID=A0A2L1U0N4_9BACL|nr:Hsp20/alpha crystallin family protein [Paenibacillus larvae]AQT83333.1 hypothetical protein B1222_00890 [Paenibacillus larvae subsp. pulvifaciens]AQZ48469.1 hypothetical protein B5S25_19645 [Paenibacillus larvae subsp. pulvifaciens]AVF26482.1 hypothetical protein ERICIII_02322 [Paenibacillus larvae subsp. larvae]AVF31258.1 hypothetical protein ERICIV_02342 [Paenibacillus larvae subsp. larvae]MBH0341428.1 hypothetical protein [Paenibacillus larvae]